MHFLRLLHPHAARVQNAFGWWAMCYSALCIACVYVAYVIVKYLKSYRTRLLRRGWCTKHYSFIIGNFFLFPHACPVFLLFFVRFIYRFRFFSHASSVTVIIRSFCRICCCYFNLYCRATIDRATYIIIYVCYLSLSVLCWMDLDTMEKYTDVDHSRASCEKLVEMEWVFSHW